MLSHEQAAGHYRRALRALRRADPDRAPLRAAARARQRRGALRASGGARDVRARGDARAARGRAAEGWRGRRWASPGRHAEAGIVDRDGIALLEEALDAPRREESRAGACGVRARRSPTRCTSRRAEERTMALSRAALEMARRIGDPEALVAALQSRHAALLHVSHLDERLALDERDPRAGRADRRARARGARAPLAHLRPARGGVDGGGARRARGAGAARRQLRQPLYHHFALGWEVVWAQMSGRVAEAERLAREAHELGQRAQARDADTIYAAQLLTLRRREDRLAEYVSTVETFVERHPALVAWRAVLPLAHLLNGEREEGCAAFEELAEDDFAAIPRDMFWFTAMCVLARGVLAARRRARAPGSSTRCCCRTATAWSRSPRRRASAPPSASSGCWRQPSATSTRPPSTSRRRSRRTPSRGVLPLIPFIRVEYAQVLLARCRACDAERAQELLEAPPAARPRRPGSRCSSPRLRPLLTSAVRLRPSPSPNTSASSRRAPRSAAYKIRSLIAQGGMGRVYRAAGPDGEEVALKLLKADLARDDARPPPLRPRGPHRPAHRPPPRRPGAGRRRARGHAVSGAVLRARRRAAGSTGSAGPLSVADAVRWPSRSAAG